MNYIYPILSHGSRIVAKKIFQRKKWNSDRPRIHYNKLRKKLLQDFRSSPPTTVEEYGLVGIDPNGLLLKGSSTNDIRAMRAEYIAELSRAIESYNARSILEVGCGDGRNVLALSQRYPDIQTGGFDIDKFGIELAREAVHHYGLSSNFHDIDATSDWRHLPPADIVYSVHALEQIPDVEGIIRMMLEKANLAVVMLEPFPDYWTGVWGLASKLRAKDKLRLAAGNLRNFELNTAQIMDFGYYLNRPALVIIKKGGAS